MNQKLTEQNINLIRYYLRDIGLSHDLDKKDLFIRPTTVYDNGQIVGKGYYVIDIRSLYNDEQPAIQIYCWCNVNHYLRRITGLLNNNDVVNIHDNLFSFLNANQFDIKIYVD